MGIKDALLKSWNKPNVLTGVLRPLSHLYRGAFSLRKVAFDKGVLHSYKAPVPLIVVGNLTVGGTGKTPLVLHLVQQLQLHGWSPGVISRGYSGEAPSYPFEVTAESDVAHSGDEPALIVRRTGAPMVVGSDRRASIETLLAKYKVDIIVSDDGLQHLALQRDIEICLIDDTSQQMNDNLLPAGPYREPMSRLLSVDFIVRHGGDVGNADNQFSMHLKAGEPKPLLAENPTTFDSGKIIKAIAGIGNPQRFFDTCRSQGWLIEPHNFDDHHQFSKADIDYGEATVLMTEKDAVKCLEFADNRHWYLPVDAELSTGFTESILEKLATLKCELLPKNNET